MSTENNNNGNRTATVQEIEGLLAEPDIVGIETQEDLEQQYYKKAHEQQKARAEEITTIFTNYRKQQEERYHYKKEQKPIIVRLLVILVFVIIAAMVTLSVLLICRHNIDAAVATVLISGFVTCFGSVLSILIVIVKYIFPEDEDNNFNSLVTSIIENDTQRIKNDNDYQIGKQK